MTDLQDLSPDILARIAANLATKADAQAVFQCCKELRAVAACPLALVHYHLSKTGSASSTLRKLTSLWQQSSWSEQQALPALAYLLRLDAHTIADADMAAALKSVMQCFKPSLALALLEAGAPVTSDALQAAVIGCGATASDASLAPLQLLLPHFTSLFHNPSTALAQLAAPLHAAVIQDKSAVLTTLLSAFPTTDVPAVKDSLLLAAAQHGAHGCMVELLSQGCSNAAKDGALLESARRGSVGVVLLALQYGADVHAQQDLALREAAGFDDSEHKEVVKVLISSGADVHVDHDSPLLAASTHGHTDVVALLLQHGAHVSAQGGAALVAACMHGHKEVAQLLLDGGAPVNAQQGMPLIRAAASGHTALVHLLLLRGADVHAQYGAALVAGARGGYLHVVQLLLAAGADAVAEENAALCEAVAHGHVPVISTLLSAGADVRALEDDVEAMCRAAAHNHWAALDVVLHTPPPLNAPLLEVMGSTLLAVAGRAGCAAVVALLLSLGVADHGSTRLARSSSSSSSSAPPARGLVACAAG